MQIFLEQVLDVHALAAVTEALTESDLFEDGKKTAGRTAKAVKNNLQAQPAAVEVKGASKLIEKTLLSHSVFSAAALPAKIAKVMFSRYEKGMSYGTHVDDPVIAGARTDLSFTLFLSEPESYDGGELILQKHDGDEAIKLAAGSMVLYPSTSLHRVAEVTRGVRLTAVGWVQSQVRSAEQREILFDLHCALANLPELEVNKQARLDILKARGNLLRRWI